MASTLGQAVAQALAWGLVDETSIVDGDLEVSSSARRNLNLRIERRFKPGYLIKQADFASGAAETVANEAAFYQLCANEPAAAPVAASMPPFVDSLESGRVLILELVRDARSLWQEYREHGPPKLPSAPPLELGRILANLHTTFGESSSFAARRPPGMRTGPPDYFRFHEPHPSVLLTASPARLALCRCLQEEPAVGRGLAAAHKSWRAETTIHGDVRSENVLIAGPKGHPQVLLVDWELTQLGDPAWDLAGALEDHARFWLESMSPSPELNPAERLASARWPLPLVQAAVHNLWAGYSAAAARTPESLAPLLRRAVTMSAARMLQTAWEHCRYLERLPALSVLLLQLAANILTDPERTAVELYGLDEVDRT